MLANRDAKREVEERNLFYKNLEESSKIEEPKDDKYDNYMERQERVNNARNVQYEYTKFIDSIDKILLAEAFSKIFDKSRALIYTIRKDSNGKDIIRKYFNECNILDLKRKLQNENTLFLNDLLNAVNEAHDEIMSHVDKNNEKTFNISQDDMESFYDKLDSETFTDAAEMIRSRVSTAVQDFVAVNKADKARMEELLNTTKSNIDSLSPTTSQEETAKIVESIQAKYKRDIGNVKDRDKSLLEEMVYSNYEEILKSTELMNEFCNESGRIDIDIIIEYTEIQYTVLEMLNTLKVDVLDENKIINLLS